jgi:YhcH/YjgK/YiaL family protein
MIVDTLSNASRYRGLSLLLDRALEAMERLVARPPADGRHELAGADISASLSSYATDDPAAKGFEAHGRYIDIQVVLRGSETLYWAPLASLEPQGEYSEAKDIAFYAGPAGLAVPLEPGWFTVLFPQDAHKPGCLRGSSAQVRKLVIKVAV